MNTCGVKNALSIKTHLFGSKSFVKSGGKTTSSWFLPREPAGWKKEAACGLARWVNDGRNLNKQQQGSRRRPNAQTHSCTRRSARHGESKSAKFLSCSCGAERAGVEPPAVLHARQRLYSQLKSSRLSHRKLLPSGIFAFATLSLLKP